MVYAVVFSLTVLIAPDMVTTMRRSLDNLKGVERDIMLPDSQIANITMPGIMTCSRACLCRRRCQSFNFNVDTGECQLNSRTVGSNTTALLIHNNFLFSDISHWPERLAGACANHTCPLNSVCEPVNKTQHVCKVIFCLDIPTVENGHFSKEPDASLLGAIQPLVCDTGFMPEGEVVCQDGGTWPSAVCVSVASCSMVKQYQPDSEDGEYWLRLTSFDNYTTKLHCHNMNTSSPKEFLTLPHINYGIYPRIMSEGCNGETELNYTCEGKGGEIWFSKIKVSKNTMKVQKSDITFANFSHNGNELRYGVADDCHTRHMDKELSCGTRGRFTIDLRGTGWRVSEEVRWVPHGTEAIIERVDRQMNGSLIELHCGGFPGGCSPGKLYLIPFPADHWP